eukprot:6198669-Pleurochrysis_carterae.AAC.1
MQRPLRQAEATATNRGHCGMRRPLRHAEETATCGGHCNKWRPLRHAEATATSGGHAKLNNNTANEFENCGTSELGQ